MTIPTTQTRWDANLKHYKLDNNNRIIGKNSQLVFTNNKINTSSQDYWSNTPDGGFVLKGGVVNQMPNQRNIWTDNVKNNQVETIALHQQSNYQLYGVNDGDDQEKNEIIDWAYSKTIGDSLFGSQKLVHYFINKKSKTSDSTLFFGTNFGFLHGVDVSHNNEYEEVSTSGREQFAYIPSSLLKQLKFLKDNNAPSKLYGMDGPIDTWIYDKNNDGDVLSTANGAADTGEFVYLYAGMRRGGSEIHSLDVTDRKKPTFRWKISDDQPEFSALGQTWSSPKAVKIHWKGKEKQVLIFGGGYDKDRDEKKLLSGSDPVGNSIYIADAISGNKLWSASETNMKYSIPSNITAIDSNSDSVVDVLFAIDIGGQLWRIDLPKDSSPKIKRRARLSTPEDIQHARYFFYRPNVSITQRRGARSHFNIVIGSGNVTDPLENKTKNRLYVLKEPLSLTSDIITESDLYDATANKIQAGDTNTRNLEINKLKEKKGWYIDLEKTGEKVLSPTATQLGKIFFTTYIPPVSTANNDPCAPPKKGEAKLYILSIDNGSAAFNLSDIQSPPSKNTRSLSFTPSMIPTTPVILPDKTGTASVMVGLQKITSIPYKQLHKVYWKEMNAN